MTMHSRFSALIFCLCALEVGLVFSAWAECPEGMEAKKDANGNAVTDDSGAAVCVPPWTKLNGDGKATLPEPAKDANGNVFPDPGAVSSEQTVKDTLKATGSKGTGDVSNGWQDSYSSSSGNNFLPQNNPLGQNPGYWSDFSSNYGNLQGQVHQQIQSTYLPDTGSGVQSPQNFWQSQAQSIGNLNSSVVQTFQSNPQWGGSGAAGGVSGIGTSTLGGETFSSGIGGTGGAAPVPGLTGASSGPGSGGMVGGSYVGDYLTGQPVTPASTHSSQPSTVSTYAPAASSVFDTGTSSVDLYPNYDAMYGGGTGVTPVEGGYGFTGDTMSRYTSGFDSSGSYYNPTSVDSQMPAYDSYDDVAARVQNNVQSELSPRNYIENTTPDGSLEGQSGGLINVEPGEPVGVSIGGNAGDGRDTGVEYVSSDDVTDGGSKGAEGQSGGLLTGEKTVTDADVQRVLRENSSQPYMDDSEGKWRNPDGSDVNMLAGEEATEARAKKAAAAPVSEPAGQEQSTMLDTIEVTPEDGKKDKDTNSNVVVAEEGRTTSYSEGGSAKGAAGNGSSGEAPPDNANGKASDDSGKGVATKGEGLLQSDAEVAPSEAPKDQSTVYGPPVPDGLNDAASEPASPSPQSPSSEVSAPAAETPAAPEAPAAPAAPPAEVKAPAAPEAPAAPPAEVKAPAAPEAPAAPPAEVKAPAAPAAPAAPPAEAKAPAAPATPAAPPAEAKAPAAPAAPAAPPAGVKAPAAPKAPAGPPAESRVPKSNGGIPYGSGSGYGSGTGSGFGSITGLDGIMNMFKGMMGGGSGGGSSGGSSNGASGGLSFAGSVVPSANVVTTPAVPAVPTPATPSTNGLPVPTVASSGSNGTSVGSGSGDTPSSGGDGSRPDYREPEKVSPQKPSETPAPVVVCTGDNCGKPVSSVGSTKWNGAVKTAEAPKSSAAPAGSSVAPAYGADTLRNMANKAAAVAQPAKPASQPPSQVAATPDNTCPTGRASDCALDPKNQKGLFDRVLNSFNPVGTAEAKQPARKSGAPQISAPLPPEIEEQIREIDNPRMTFNATKEYAARGGFFNHDAVVEQLKREARTQGSWLNKLLNPQQRAIAAKWYLANGFTEDGLPKPAAGADQANKAKPGAASAPAVPAVTPPAPAAPTAPAAGTKASAAPAPAAPAVTPPAPAAPAAPADGTKAPAAPAPAAPAVTPPAPAALAAPAAASENVKKPADGSAQANAGAENVKKVTTVKVSKPLPETLPSIGQAVTQATKDTEKAPQPAAGPDAETKARATVATPQAIRQMLPQASAAAAQGIATQVNAYLRGTTPGTAFHSILQRNGLVLTGDVLRQQLLTSGFEGNFQQGVDAKAEASGRMGQVRGFNQISDDQLRQLDRKYTGGSGYFSPAQVRADPNRDAEAAMLQTLHRTNLTKAELNGRTPEQLGMTMDQLIYGKNPMGNGASVEKVAARFRLGMQQLAQGMRGLPDATMWVKNMDLNYRNYSAAATTVAQKYSDFVFSSTGGLGTGGPGQQGFYPTSYPTAEAVRSARIVTSELNIAGTIDAVTRPNAFVKNEGGQLGWTAVNPKSGRVDFVPATAMQKGVPIGMHPLNRGSGFGDRRGAAGNLESHSHEGGDWMTKRGMPVYAQHDGVVMRVGNEGNGGGNMGNRAWIRGADGKITTTGYGHMDKVYVQPGQKVRAGDLIGTVGNSGARWSSPHLHLETRVGGQGNSLGTPVDPNRGMPELYDKVEREADARGTASNGQPNIPNYTFTKGIYGNTPMLWQNGELSSPAQSVSEALSGKGAGTSSLNAAELSPVPMANQASSLYNDTSKLAEGPASKAKSAAVFSGDAAADGQVKLRNLADASNAGTFVSAKDVIQGQPGTGTFVPASGEAPRIVNRNTADVVLANRPDGALAFPRQADDFDDHTLPPRGGRYPYALTQEEVMRRYQASYPQQQNPWNMSGMGSGAAPSGSGSGMAGLPVIPSRAGQPVPVSSTSPTTASSKTTVASPTVPVTSTAPSPTVKDASTEVPAAQKTGAATTAPAVSSPVQKASPVAWSKVQSIAYRSNASAGKGASVSGVADEGVAAHYSELGEIGTSAGKAGAAASAPANESLILDVKDCRARAVGKPVRLEVDKAKGNDLKIKAYVARYQQLKMMDFGGCAACPDGVKMFVKLPVSPPAAKPAAARPAAVRPTVTNLSDVLEQKEKEQKPDWFSDPKGSGLR